MDTIKKRSTFVRISQYGIRSKTNNIILLCLHDPSLHGVEVGYTASKKVGNAVARNFAKRRLRNVVARLRHVLQNSYRYVFIAKASTTTCAFNSLDRDICWCIKNVHYKYRKQLDETML